MNCEKAAHYRCPDEASFRKKFIPLHCGKVCAGFKTFRLLLKSKPFFLLFATQFQHQSFVIAANKFQSCICIE